MSNTIIRPLFAGGAKYPTLVSISPGGYYARGGSHVLDSYTASWSNPPVSALAAGRVEEYGDDCGTANHPDIEATHMIGPGTSLPWMIDLFWSQDGIRQGSLNPNCMCGFGVGSLLANVPNPVTTGVGPPFPNAPSFASVQVQFRHIAAQDDIYLYVSPGDGSTPAVSSRLHLGQTSGITGLTAQNNASHRLQLENVPGKQIILRCTDLFDGIIRSTSIDISAMSFGPLMTGFYLFAYTGTGSATGQQINFSDGWVTLFPRDPWILGGTVQ